MGFVVGRLLQEDHRGDEMDAENREAGPFEEEKLTEEIIECVIAVHRELGPGFIESVYHNAMLIELVNRGFKVDTEHRVNIYYSGKLVGRHRLDIVVAGKVILEAKAIEELTKVDYARLRSYLRATGLRVALLVNFSKEKADFRRVELNH
jgi:GxxExxY protein